jgi:hypothetical protein
MEGHRTAERRSLAYHQEIAERLRADPSLLDLAHDRVRGWAERGDVDAKYVGAWRRLLELPVEQIVRHICEESPRMTALRQVSPFGGVLDARTRWQIWRSIA